MLVVLLGRCVLLGETGNAYYFNFFFFFLYKKDFNIFLIL